MFGMSRRHRVFGRLEELEISIDVMRLISY